MAAPLLLLLLPLSRAALSPAQPSESAAAAPHRRFEYKYSFKGPHLAQADGTVPFWLHTGNAIPSTDQIRITTSLKSQKGSVWTKNKSTFQFWEVEVTFRVTGRGRLGADGLAIWFTAEQGLEGPVFGAADQWNGVGIFFDSFDNDGKKNNPGVVVVGNNGKLLYDHQNDGSSQALAACQRDFRNKPYPVRVKITYYQKILTILINNGFTPEKEDYEFCAKVENMVLPPEGYFGISAATGGLADDHDVLSFLTFQLTEPGKETPPSDAAIPPQDKEKYHQQFEHFQQELEKKKEEFQREHPDVQGQEAENIFHPPSDHELQQIFQGQNRIHLDINQLSRQLEILLESSREQLGQLSHQELQTILKTQEELIRQVKEIRSSVGDALSSLSTAQLPFHEINQHFIDIKEHLHLVRRDVEHLAQKNRPSSDKPKCPELEPFPSCLSTLHFLIFVALQSALLLAYVVYRSQQEAAAKKFF